MERRRPRAAMAAASTEKPAERKDHWIMSNMLSVVLPEPDEGFLTSVDIGCPV